MEHLVETVTYLLAQCRKYFLFMIPVVGSQHSSMIDTASNLLYVQLVSEKEQGELDTNTQFCTQIKK